MASRRNFFLDVFSSALQVCLRQVSQCLQYWWYIKLAVCQDRRISIDQIAFEALYGTPYAHSTFSRVRKILRHKNPDIVGSPKHLRGTSSWITGITKEILALSVQIPWQYQRYLHTGQQCLLKMAQPQQLTTRSLL